MKTFTGNNCSRIFTGRWIKQVLGLAIEIKRSQIKCHQLQHILRYIKIIAELIGQRLASINMTIILMLSSPTLRFPLRTEFQLVRGRARTRTTPSEKVWIIISRWLRTIVCSFNSIGDLEIEVTDLKLMPPCSPCPHATVEERRKIFLEWALQAR